MRNVAGRRHQAVWLADGRLSVARYLPAPHGCARCASAPNLCKGAVIAAWLAAADPATRVVYVGDGANDYCPAASLRPCVSWGGGATLARGF